MQRIGLFGGSFNPIHLGHLHLVQTAMACLKLDQVILIPAAVSPFKQHHPDMASPEDRLMMCRLAAETIQGCQVDDCELSRGGVSYTIDTIRQLRERYPKAQLVLLLGSDMFLSFPKWRNWQEILALAELGVVSREVDDQAILARQKQKLQEYGSVSLCLAPPFPVSSTEIREKCKKHQDCSCYLPEKVVQYIRMRKLYQTPWIEGGKAVTKLSEYEAYLEDKLSSKRFRHSVNVAVAAKMLAKRYGGVDPEKAYFAGLVHDICKEEPKEVQYTLVLESDLDVCAEERRSWKVWHGIAGAQLLRTQFGVTDPDVLNAVRYHTVGRGGMSTLEQIVYLADLISQERKYSDVEVMRQKAMESLAGGMLYALEFSLVKLIHRHSWIPHHTIDAYHEYLAIQTARGKDEQTI